MGYRRHPKLGQDYQIRRSSKSPYYYVRFTCRGERFELSTKRRTKAEATKEAEQIVVGAWEIKSTARQEGSVEDWVNQWLADTAGSYSTEYQATLRIYANRWQWSCLSDITGQSIQKHIAERLRSVSSGTVRKELSGLRRFLTYLQNCGAIRGVPKWQAPKGSSDYRAEHLTAEEVEKLLAELPSRKEHLKGEPVREYFTLLWETGLRKGTIERMLWSDVDLDQRTIHIRGSIDKARYQRTVPLTKKAAAVLASMPRDAAVVFGRRDYRTSLKQAAERIGLEVARLGCHTFRHSRLTDLGQRTTNIAALQSIAGHRTLSSSSRYIHTTFSAAKELIDAVDYRENDGECGG